MSPSELEELEQSVVAARERLAQAVAEDRLLRAGSPEADRAVSRAAVTEAEALVAQGKTELERLTVCAPLAGTVLQVNLHPGEAAGGRPEVAPVVLGGTRPLSLRVDLDAHLLGRFRPGAPARASPRGRPGAVFPLRFLRVEPLVVPRRVLNGEGGERSDARVLQVLYELDPGPEVLHVGQQMDVFLEAAPAGGPPRGEG
jgi:multidrug efflux pump subunit AcrA (membrane-fusion protein)